MHKRALEYLDLCNLHDNDLQVQMCIDNMRDQLENGYNYLGKHYKLTDDEIESGIMQIIMLSKSQSDRWLRNRLDKLANMTPDEKHKLNEIDKNRHNIINEMRKKIKEENPNKTDKEVYEMAYKEYEKKYYG